MNQYFDTLERLFKGTDPVIEDGKDQIDWAIFYVDDSSYNLWCQVWDKLAPEEANNYKSFKKAITTHYPVHLWTGWIETRADYGQFYREFYAISNFLIDQNRISVIDQNRMFRNVFWHPKGTNNLWDKMEDYLQVKSVDLPMDDILPMDKYRKAVEWALRATSAMTAEAQSASLPSTRPTTAIPMVLPKMHPELEKKIERLASENKKLQGMFSTVLSLFQAQQQHQMYPPQQF
ncbi:hypothetical protein CALCODRAFT_488632 [Calocera cornea HHB12733]|uniref:Uncharacterized protein n=1 Tax=Calocera cornea HHB12733 TaxID=1353952 RepID=A0A165CBD2_9BASI|nr:hypothetical protein CALCODRAFT_488632 [Calocera cornea HHB12733]